MAAPAAAAAAGGGAGGGAAAGGGGAAGAPGGAGGAPGGGGAKDGGAKSRLPDQLGRMAKRRAFDKARREARKRAEQLVKLGLGALALLLTLLGLILLPLLMVQALADALNPFGGSGGYPANSGIPQVYWPMYTTAANYYKVNPYLLASIHRQETGFSTNPSTSSGVNGSGCCAGPMQFNIRAGVWESHKYAFRPIADARPSSYPLDRSKLPSCRGVPKDTGCVYDDFDAIAGAAHMLRAGGADTSLYSQGTRKAVCAYIGSCSEVDSCTGSQNEYCQVLPRARQWELSGGASPAQGAKGIVEQAVAIARRFGTSVYVCSDFRPGSVTEDGHVSDHASNDASRAARDIAVRGRDCIAGPPSAALDQAAVAIGDYFGRSYRPATPILADTFRWHGYRIQIIWRTPRWGGHMGHIHIGASRQ